MTLVDEETGEPYSDEYLRDIVLNFIIAGRDTTAQLLSWTFYMLSTHPKEQELVLTIYLSAYIILVIQRNSVYISKPRRSRL